jgi:hypothetical protein
VEVIISYIMRKLDVCHLLTSLIASISWPAET